MHKVESYVRAPKQQRSRRSFDKALDAAVSLLVERGSDAFTLNEVAHRGGVSTGSIYGRVASKDDLLRSAHAREMDRISARQREAFAAPPPDGESFDAAVRRIIRTLAELLRADAPVLAPFMTLSVHDPVIAEAGRAAYHDLVAAFRTALLERRADIRHPEPERAVEWSVVVVYSVLARWLGLGSQPGTTGQGDWEQILADLGEMVTAFLIRPERSATGT